MSFFRAILLLAVAGAASLRAASHDRHLTGNPADAQPTGVRGGLLLCGGGGDVDDAFRWFSAQTAGGDLVVLRAAGGDGYNDYLYTTIGGFDSVESIVFHNAAAAHDPGVLAAIAGAEALFIAGGDQSRYVNFWRGTPVGKALARHIAAGRPIGGTSAGLAILGEHYFPAALDTIDSATALADPFEPRVRLGSDFLRIPALEGVLTDSHFMARDRLGRLLVFLARIATEQPAAAARLVGLGIDEKTALGVDPDGSARVFTATAGKVWLVQLAGATDIAPGRPVASLRARVTGFGPESTLNLPAREVTAPVETRTVVIRDGRQTSSP